MARSCSRGLVRDRSRRGAGPRGRLRLGGPGERPCSLGRHLLPGGLDQQDVHGDTRDEARREAQAAPRRQSHRPPLLAEAGDGRGRHTAPSPHPQRRCHPRRPGRLGSEALPGSRSAAPRAAGGRDGGVAGVRLPLLERGLRAARRGPREGRGSQLCVSGEQGDLPAARARLDWRDPRPSDGNPAGYWLLQVPAGGGETGGAAFGERELRRRRGRYVHSGRSAQIPDGALARRGGRERDVAPRDAARPVDACRGAPSRPGLDDLERAGDRPARPRRRLSRLHDDDRLRTRAAGLGCDLDEHALVGERHGHRRRVPLHRRDEGALAEDVGGDGWIEPAPPSGASPAGTGASGASCSWAESTTASS